MNEVCPSSSRAVRSTPRQSVPSVVYLGKPQGIWIDEPLWGIAEFNACDAEFVVEPRLGDYGTDEDLPLHDCRTVAALHDEFAEFDA